MKDFRMRSSWIVLVAVALAVFGCGGAGGGEGAEAAAPAEPAGPSPAEQGEQVAQEILAAFDDVVAEVTGLIAEDPNAEVLMPKIQATLTAAEARMTELNGRLLALRDADIESFGAANSYLGEHRGEHVHAKDVAFAPLLMDYPGEDPNGEVKEFLSGSSLAKLLDLATQIS